MGEIDFNNAKEVDNALRKINNNPNKIDIDIIESFVTRIMDMFPAYYDSNKILYLYNEEENLWTISDERDIVNLAKHIFEAQGLNDSRIRIAFTNAFLDRARWIKPKDMPKDWLQFNNCYIDLKTLKTYDVSRDYFSQVKIPHNFVMRKPFPIIEEKIKSWVGEDQYKLFLQICAYCMLNRYPFARFFIFYGTGQDGKSTAGDFLTRLIGEDNTCNIDVESLGTNRFEAHKLYQKTLAIAGEIDYSLLKNTKRIKQITGGDPISMEFKRKDAFMYVNTAKMIWYANGVPPTYDKTDGFYRRPIIIKFPNKFAEVDDPLGDIPEKEYDYFSTYLVEVLRDLLENGFEEPSLDEKRELYENLSNPVKMFCNENLIESDIDDFVKLSDLYQEYNMYRVKHSLRELRYEQFISTLKIDYDNTKKINFWVRKDNGELNYKKDELFGYEERRVQRHCLMGYNLKSKDVSTVSTVSTGVTSKNTIREISENTSTRSTQSTQDKNKICELCKNQQDQELLISLFGDEIIEDMITQGMLFPVKPGVLKALE